MPCEKSRFEWKINIWFISVNWIPKIQEKQYPNCDKKKTYTCIKWATDTVYSKPMAEPDSFFSFNVLTMYIYILLRHQMTGDQWFLQ